MRVITIELDERDIERLEELEKEEGAQEKSQALILVRDNYNLSYRKGGMCLWIKYWRNSEGI